MSDTAIIANDLISVRPFLPTWEPASLAWNEQVSSLRWSADSFYPVAWPYEVDPVLTERDWCEFHAAVYETYCFLGYPAWAGWPTPSTEELAWIRSSVLPWVEPGDLALVSPDPTTARILIPSTDMLQGFSLIQRYGGPSMNFKTSPSGVIGNFTRSILAASPNSGCFIPLRGSFLTESGFSGLVDAETWHLPEDQIEYYKNEVGHACTLSGSTGLTESACVESPLFSSTRIRGLADFGVNLSVGASIGFEHLFGIQTTGSEARDRQWVPDAGMSALMFAGLGSSVGPLRAYYANLLRGNIAEGESIPAEAIPPADSYWPTMLMGGGSVFAPHCRAVSPSVCFPLYSFINSVLPDPPVFYKAVWIQLPRKTSSGSDGYTDDRPWDQAPDPFPQNYADTMVLLRGITLTEAPYVGTYPSNECEIRVGSSRGAGWFDNDLPAEYQAGFGVSQYSRSWDPNGSATPVQARSLLAGTLVDPTGPPEWPSEIVADRKMISKITIFAVVSLTEATSGPRYHHSSTFPPMAETFTANSGTPASPAAVFDQIIATVGDTFGGVGLAELVANATISAGFPPTVTSEETGEATRATVGPLPRFTKRIFPVWASNTTDPGSELVDPAALAAALVEAVPLSLATAIDVYAQYPQYTYYRKWVQNAGYTENRLGESGDLRVRFNVSFFAKVECHFTHYRNSPPS